MSAPLRPAQMISRNPARTWLDRAEQIAALLQAAGDSLRGRTQRGELLVGQSLAQLARRHGVKLVGRTIDAEGKIVRLEDGRELAVDTIIWATGYRSDYSWIEVPVFDARGEPRHQRGVTEAPGLYFLGMHDQYSRGSSLIHWSKMTPPISSNKPRPEDTRTIKVLARLTGLA